MLPWWASTRVVLAVTLAAIVAAALVGAYAAGAGRERDRWQQKFLAAERAAARAVAERAELERDAANRLRIVTDAHSAEIDRRRRADAAVRADLERLRDAIAAGGGGAGPTAAAGPAADGACAVTRELFGACAADFARMGDEAGKLAAQVKGLQATVRVAQATCGPAAE